MLVPAVWPRRARSIVGGYAYHVLNRRLHGSAEEQSLLSEPPVPLNRLWCDYVNRPQTEAELQAIRRCVTRGQPFGGDDWRTKVMRQLGLEHTFRPRGRPRKQPETKTDSRK
jgi:putative transposase